MVGPPNCSVICWRMPALNVKSRNGIGAGMGGEGEADGVGDGEAELVEDGDTAPVEGSAEGEADWQWLLPQSTAKIKAATIRFIVIVVQDGRLGWKSRGLRWSSCRDELRRNSSAHGWVLVGVRRGVAKFRVQHSAAQCSAACAGWGRWPRFCRPGAEYGFVTKYVKKRLLSTLSPRQKPTHTIVPTHLQLRLSTYKVTSKLLLVTATLLSHAHSQPQHAISSEWS